MAARRPIWVVVYPTGAGETRLLPTPGIQRIFRGVWTPDGAGIVFAGEEKGSPVRLYTQKLTEGTPRRIGTDGLTLPFSTALVSPDGAAVLASTPENDFVLVPLDGSDTRPAKALRARDLPLGWEPDAQAMIVGEGGSEWPVKLVRVWDAGRAMGLTLGTSIGVYRIVAPLGAGGMGEVYRARDGQLGREVAIKVLPAAVATDADRLMRVGREAMTPATPLTVRDRRP